MRTQVLLRLDQELLDRLDSKRGLVPRNAWLVDLIEKSLPESQAGLILTPATESRSSKVPEPKQEEPYVLPKIAKRKGW